MAYLNANIPPIYCKIRTEYLYDLDSTKRGERECVIFGLSSISGRAILFHIMFPNGAIYYRLPISAFFQKRFSREQVPDMQVDELQLWNCFSYWPNVHIFDWLAGVEGKYRGKDKKIYKGEYLSLLSTGRILKLIFLIPNILKFLKNISVRIYWLLLTVIMQLSLIIAFCGMLIITLLSPIGQIIRSKLLTGTLKVRNGLRKILTKCSMK